MKNKKGFTLIELLAVIIILGILMIIAIPSVTKYINDSRKNSYVDTAKEIMSGARNLVNEGKLGMYDTNTTYFIPSSYIKTENASKSPYGDFVQAYVVVTYDGTGYKYYWTSVDDAGQGVKEIISYDKLEVENIESDLNPDTIDPTKAKIGVGNRREIKVLDNNGNWIHEIHLDNAIDNISDESINIVCKKATTLHTKTCERESEGCGASIGNGNTITYGTLVSGTRKAGDAYDCDINNDGTYDSATERFYYVTSDKNNSTLIYYTNLNDQEMHAYDSSNENWHGPRTGYEYLPNAAIWSNPYIISPGARNIVTETGTTSTSGGTIDSFTYNDKVVRFLTSQEVNKACGITVGSKTNGELDVCNFLMENIGYYEKDSGTRSNGYWLESPRSDSIYSIWYVNGNDRRVYSSYSYNANYHGIRPTIVIKTNNLES